MNARNMSIGQEVQHEGLSWALRGRTIAPRCDGCEAEPDGTAHYQFRAFDDIKQETHYANWCADCVDVVCAEGKVTA